MVPRPGVPSATEVVENGDDAFNCSPSSLRAIGDSLLELNAGCYASCELEGKTYSTIFYSGVNVPVRLCYVLKNALFVGGSQFLSSLISKSERRQGSDVKWNCESKGSGRYQASCQFFGKEKRRSVTGGLRKKTSKKVGCEANLLANPVIAQDLAHRQNVPLGTKIHIALAESVVSKFGDESASKRDILKITRCHMRHTKHAVEFVEDDPNASPIFSSSVALQDLELRKHLLNFVECAGSHSRGNVIRATRYLKAVLPGKSYHKGVVRNCLQLIQSNAEDAKELVEAMRRWKSSSKIEFLRYESHKDKGLSYLFFTIKGAKKLSCQYGEDVCVIDSTHHVTKYEYKLVSLQYVDCELVSRPFAFAIMLEETPKDYLALFDDVCAATQQQLPRVIFSDQDSSIISALTLLHPQTVRNGISPVRITCLWHLVDLNMRKAVGSSIKGGAVNWKCFREDFIAVRNSSSEDELNSRFPKLLQMWFCKTEDCDNGPTCDLHEMGIHDFQSMEFENTRSGRAQRYMMDHVWSINANWALCFFPHHRTLGMQSSQRAESWHSTIKSITSSNMSMSAIFQAISDHAIKKGSREQSNMCSISSLKKLSDMPLLSKKDVALLSESGRLLSKEPASILHEEVVASTKQNILSTEFRIVRENDQMYFKIRALCSNVSAPIQSVADVQGEGNEFSRVVIIMFTIESSGDGFVLRNSTLKSMSCSCMFWDRMGIPCRHLLSVSHSFRMKRMSSECTIDAHQEVRPESNELVAVDMNPLDIVKSVLEEMVRGGGRWILPDREAPSEPQSASQISNQGHPGSEFLSRRTGASNAPIQADSNEGSMSRDLFYRREEFPLQNCFESNTQGFGILASLGRALAEKCTGRNANRFYGALWSRALSQFLHDFDEMSRESEGLLIRSHKHILLRAVNAAIHDVENRSAPLLLGSSSEERLVPIQNDEIQSETERNRRSQLRSNRLRQQTRAWNAWNESNHLRNIENRADEPPRETQQDVVDDVPAVLIHSGGGGKEDSEFEYDTIQNSLRNARKALSRLEALEENGALPQPIFSSSEDSSPHARQKGNRIPAEQLTVDSTHELSSSAIPDNAGQLQAENRENETIPVSNPRPRAWRALGSNDASVREHMRRKNIRRRRNRARSQPSNSQLRGAPSAASAGYCCPYCTKIKVLNNERNVVQHIVAKHKLLAMPTREAMREAAASLPARIAVQNNPRLAPNSATPQHAARGKHDLPLSKAVLTENEEGLAHENTPEANSVSRGASSSGTKRALELRSSVPRKRRKRVRKRSAPTRRISVSSEESSSDEDESDDDEDLQSPTMEEIREAQDRKRLLNTLCSDELAIIRQEFVKFYPAPPSNGQAQGRYQLQNGLRSMTDSQARTLWENTLGPWSKKWWSLFQKFNDLCREKKRKKTRRDPTLVRTEVRKWAESFRSVEGPARTEEQNG